MSRRGRARFSGPDWYPAVVATYPIRLFGDPVLKQQSREVVELDGELAGLDRRHVRDDVRERRRRPRGRADRRAQAVVHLRRRRRPDSRHQPGDRGGRGRGRLRRGLPLDPRAPLRDRAAGEDHGARRRPRMGTRSWSKTTSSSAACSSTRWTTSTACCCSTGSTPPTASGRSGRCATASWSRRCRCRAEHHGFEPYDRLRLQPCESSSSALLPTQCRRCTRSAPRVTTSRSCVTQPDRRRGRGGRSVPSPVKSAALELGLPVLTPGRARGSRRRRARDRARSSASSSRSASCCRPRCSTRCHSGSSTCTSRCCRAGAVPRRSSGRSSPATRRRASA